MKFNNFNLWSLVLSFAILSAVGCSSITTTPISTPTITKMTTSLPATIPTLLPYTGKIAFMNSNGPGYYYHIYVMNADGSGIKDVTPPNLLLINSLDLSPDEESIAFAVSIEGTSQIFKMKADGSNLKQLTFGEQNSFSPSWSPDGKYIIFSSSDEEIMDDRHIVSLQAVLAEQIYIMKSDGSEVQRLIVKTEDENATMSGSYRNDGFISVSVPITRQYMKNYIVNLNGVIQKQFPEFTANMPIIWSPDNKYVLLTDVRTDCSGIIVMKPDGSDRECLVIDKISPQVQVYRASWSPDSKYIIFSSNLDGDFDLYVVKTDGSGLTQLTNMPGNESEPVWSAKP